MVERQVIADAVLSVYAPPAFCFPQSLQFQMPAALRFTPNLPQKSQRYLACWDTCSTAGLSAGEARRLALVAPPAS